MNDNRWRNSGNNGFRRAGYQKNAPVKQEPQKPHVALTEDNYVDQARDAINDLIQKSKEDKGKNDLIQKSKEDKGKNAIVTTSKLRNLLAMTADIYNDVILSMEEELPADVRERINYLKVRFIYESARPGAEAVKNLVETAGILGHIQDIGNSRKRYLLFSRYMEALVAYRKYLVHDRDE